MRFCAICRALAGMSGPHAMSAAMPMMVSGFFKSWTMELANLPTSAMRSACKTWRMYCRLNSRRRFVISRIMLKENCGELVSNWIIASRGTTYSVVSISASAVAERG